MTVKNDLGVVLAPIVNISLISHQRNDLMFMESLIPVQQVVKHGGKKYMN